MTTVIEPVLTAASPSAVQALVESCSAGSLAARFHCGYPVPPRMALSRYGRYLLAGPPRGEAVLAWLDGEPIGLLNITVEGATPELSVLVADRWQRRGIATWLIATCLTGERWAGRPVRVGVQPSNIAARAMLGALPAGTRRRTGAGPDWLEYAVTLPA